MTNYPWNQEEWQPDIYLLDETVWQEVEWSDQTMHMPTINEWEIVDIVDSFLFRMTNTTPDEGYY